MGSGSLGSLPAVGGSVSPPSLLFDLKCPPALEPAGCSVGPGLGAKMSASRRAHADECPSPHMSATSVHVTRVSHSRSLPPAWRLKDQQVGLAQASIKLLLWPWVLVRMRFCVCSLRASVSPNPGELLQSSPTDLQNQMLWRAPLPGAGWNSHFCGRTSVI